VLDWRTRALPAGRQRLALVRDLLAIRHREIAPYLATSTFSAAQHGDRVLQAFWRLDGHRLLLLRANLSDLPAEPPPQALTGRPIWGAEPTGALAPWGVSWSIGAD
jgi:maltooligosyltrehalose trehalohydrolase